MNRREAIAGTAALVGGAVVVEPAAQYIVRTEDGVPVCDLGQMVSARVVHQPPFTPRLETLVVPFPDYAQAHPSLRDGLLTIVYRDVERLRREGALREWPPKARRMVEEALNSEPEVRSWA